MWLKILQFRTSKFHGHTNVNMMDLHFFLFDDAVSNSKTSHSRLVGRLMNGDYERIWRRSMAICVKENGKNVSRIVRKNCWKWLLASSCPSVCPSLRLSVCSSVLPPSLRPSFAWNNPAPTGRIIMIFEIWDFLKICQGNSSFIRNGQE